MLLQGVSEEFVKNKIILEWKCLEELGLFYSSASSFD